MNLRGVKQRNCVYNLEKWEEAYIAIYYLRIGNHGVLRVR